LWQLLKKEIIDIFRNRRALYEMILIPLLMPPIFSIFFPFLLVSLTEKFFQEEIVRKISPKKLENIPRSGQKIFIENLKEVPELEEEIKKTGNLQIVEVKNPKEALEKQKIQIHLIVPKNFKKNLLSGEKIFLKTNLKIININTLICFLKLNRIIEKYNQKISTLKISNAKIKLEINNFAKPSEFTGFILGLIFPIFALFWLMMGGNSIAIDLFTAEKERKTIEFLFILPIERKTILLTKFLITVFVSILTLLLAILGMIISFILLWSNLPGVWKIYLKEIKISLTFLIIFFLFTILLSSILNLFQIFLSIISKSIKEAEYYLYPLVMIIILPGVVSIFSELSQMRNPTFLIPILNICCIYKEIFLGNYNIFHLLISGFSSLTYIFLIYKLNTYIFQKERIIFT
jgi:sodium transport system permease protein